MHEFGLKRKQLVLASTLLLAAVASGAAFAGWANHGADIFVSLASSGLAWCL